VRTIYFLNGLWHRLGHTAISVTLALLLKWMGLPVTPSWLIACVVIPIFVEILDTFAGGFIVTWEQRKAIWKRAKERGFMLSADSTQDLWEYNMAWILYPLAVFLWGV